MKFEWDKEKDRLNLIKHGVTFGEAITVFNDPLALTFEDMLHSIQSARTITKIERNIYEEGI